MDKGKNMCAIILDLIKTFDAVNHLHFLRKLMYYDARGRKFLFWIV